MNKGPEAFRTISEVAEELDIPQHVLRFWETRFPQIKPIKRAGGRRFYRPDDIALLAGIRHLLYGAGYTIRGVQKILKEHGIAHVQALIASLPYDPHASVAAVTQALELAEKPVQRSLFHDQETVSQLRPSPDLSSIDLIDDNGSSDRIKPQGRYPETGAPPTATEIFDESIPRLPLEPLIDARAATVSAAYTALTSASMPLHPRAGFVRAEDLQADGSFLQEAGAAQDKSGATFDLSPGPQEQTASSAKQVSANSVDNDYVIQPHYHLTTVTRDRLQSVLEELRECRRLLGSTTISN